jgi:hypothetical protein
MQGAGLAQLVQEIKLASENIRKTDEANREELEGIKASVNELSKRTGRPGAEWSSDLTDHVHPHEWAFRMLWRANAAFLRKCGRCNHRPETAGGDKNLGLRHVEYHATTAT